MLTCVGRAGQGIAERAYKAGEVGKFAEAAGLYEALVQKYPPRTQDDADVLLTAADYEALAGNKDRAFTLCERVLLVPAKEGAHPPAMLPGPLDLRGEARWKMAEIRRSQGRWSEALALYQLNRRTYPRDDGCVPSGYAFQEMAMVEGECLEHLGRFDEAVSLYFTAALNADASVTPEAMRRLFELYQGANQSEDLERNMVRERDKFDKEVEKRWPEDLQGRFKSRNPFVTFERVRCFRNMALSHKWNAFVETLRESVLKSQEEFGEGDVFEVNMREAVAALLSTDATARNEALRALEQIVKSNSIRDNATLQINTRAIILILGGNDENDNLTRDIESRRDKLLGRAIYASRNFAPRQPALLPKTLKLPGVLSAEVRQ